MFHGTVTVQIAGNINRYLKRLILIITRRAYTYAYIAWGMRDMIHWCYYMLAEMGHHKGIAEPGIFGVPVPPAYSGKNKRRVDEKGKEQWKIAECEGIVSNCYGGGGSLVVYISGDQPHTK